MAATLRVWVRSQHSRDYGRCSILLSAFKKARQRSKNAAPNRRVKGPHARVHFRRPAEAIMLMSQYPVLASVESRSKSVALPSENS